MCHHLRKRITGSPSIPTKRSKASLLLAKGATWADSPAAVAEQTDVVFTMVGFPARRPRGLLRRDGLLPAGATGQGAGRHDHDASLAQEILDCPKQGAFAVDAPVSGGDVGARNATLSIMVGGATEAVQAVMPLFECLGKKIVHQGGPGMGQHAKLCNQIVIAGTMIGVCESLLIRLQGGADLDRMLDSIRGGAAACWTLENLAPRILERNFDPGFFVEHFIKDMGIALEEARRRQLTLPGLALAHRLYGTSAGTRPGRAGTHALMLALEDLSHIDLPNPPASP